MEGDRRQSHVGRRFCDFYPRPPGGGRQASDTARPKLRCYFYPRPPGGGRHDALFPEHKFANISIHALRVEGDLYGGAQIVAADNFYPRPPRGGRLDAL